MTPLSFGIGLGFDTLRGAADPLTRIRSLLGDSSIVGFYWTKDGVRVSGSSVQVHDDARCSTSTGALSFPGANTDIIDCGIPTVMDGVSSACARAEYMPVVSSVSNGTVFMHSNGALSVSALGLQEDATDVYIFSGSGSIYGHFTRPWAMGTWVRVYIVYDGSLTGNANRLKLYYSTYSAGAWSAATQATLTFTGTVPATLPNASASSAHLLLGAYASAAYLPMKGLIGDIALWAGQAYTPAQMDAAVATANLRYEFNGNYNNTGTTAGFNGTTSGTSLVFCSDDVRWGRPRVSFGTNRGSRVASVFGTEAAVRFDGVTQYMLDFNTLNGAQTIVRVAKVRALPGSSDFFRSLNLASAGKQSLLFYTANASYLPRNWRMDNNAGGDVLGIADALDTSAHILGLTYNGASTTAPGSYTATLDGLARPVVAVPGGASYGAADSTVGAIVAAGVVSRPSPDDLAADLPINRALAADEMVQLQRILGTSFSVAVA
jgi:hypothetical protein